MIMHVLEVKRAYMTHWQISDLFRWKSDAVAYARERMPKEVGVRYRLYPVIVGDAEPVEIIPDDDDLPDVKPVEDALDALEESIHNAAAAAAMEG
jgi:hypothetical protein